MSTVYKLAVKTGDEEYAGTDANVYIVLYGFNGATKEMEFEGSGSRFEKGKIDHLEIHSEHNVGYLTHLAVRHDNQGQLPAWFLDYINVTVDNGNEWEFRAYRWLDIQRADKETKAVLAAYIP